MKGAFLAGLGLFALAIAPSCDSRDASCEVDTDCATGLVCREGACLSLSDGGVADAATAEAASPPTPPPGFDAGAPRCAAIYEVCLTSSDCCVGLACQAGACR